MPRPTQQVQCQYCPHFFALRGLRRHETACKRRFDEHQDNMHYEQQLFRTGLAQTIVIVPLRDENSVGADNYRSINEQGPQYNDIAVSPGPEDGITASMAPETHEEGSVHGTSEYKLDDIQTVEADEDHVSAFEPGGSPKEFKEGWDCAANLITPFEKSAVTVQLQGKDYTYDVYHQNLWVWALELIQNPILEPHFVWDAVQLSKWNGRTFEKFVDEPWTAQAFWDLQYKDIPSSHDAETFQSRFETETVSAVDMSLGGYQCRYLDQAEWGDGFIFTWQRWIFKCSLEYQSKAVIMMKLYFSLHNRNFAVLIQGANGLKPCVICLVPKLEQYNLHIKYELRTKHQTQEILADAAAIPTKGAQNRFLSGFGLQNIQNAFWDVKECNPFHALSFDPLHAHDNGWKSIGQADDQIKLFPHWRNLYHFESGFMVVHFADGGKYEDLSKHIIFVTHNILTKDNDEHSYIELCTYAGFNLHTEKSIQAIQEELLQFSVLIKEYEQLTWSVDPSTKSWNFPKVHSHQHMVDDILQKGVTLNYNTKPNEKMHGPLKDAYQLHTNFKDVAEQQLRNIEAPEDYVDELKDQDMSVSDYSGKVTLHGHRGKGGGVLKIGEVGVLKADDPAFHGFRTHISSFMTRQFQKYSDIIPEVNGRKVSFKLFKKEEEIQLHGLLKVNYENMVDWTTSTDYLQCSPDFYNRSRYDFLLVDSTKHPFFAQLIMIFTCVIGGKSFPLALVHPFDEPVDTKNEQLDKDFGFYHVHA
ncbi:hypothetical protein F5146DRAFT_1125354 [Armillaria mellea]|nr:hypothetical protein F5146DRAFT_1125354 [Armillaria mellea]